MWDEDDTAASAQAMIDANKQAVKDGLDGRGHKLPIYKSGPKKGQTVTLRDTGAMLDGLVVGSLTRDEAVVPAPTDYAIALQFSGIPWLGLGRKAAKVVTNLARARWDANLAKRPKLRKKLLGGR